MSSLRSALDELRAEDLRSLSDEALAGHLDEIERAGRVLEAERGRGVAELERRKIYAADGHLSPAAWLAHRQGMSISVAEGRVRRARALEAMPAVALAFGEGEVSESALQVLASAQEAAPEGLRALRTCAARGRAHDGHRRAPPHDRDLADVTRVVTRGASEPLELGRRTKVVPAGLRRAISVRDGGCRFPGCGRPSGWCDAHHIQHWADGGETSLANLVLLCRPHHRAIHRGFGVQMLDVRPVFERPDGSTIEDRAPPLT
jgi:hypothetical protein